MNQETNPTHYTAKGKECIVEMYELFGKEKVIAFCELNAYKYNYRQDYKAQKESDIAKSLWYGSLAIILKRGVDIHEALAIIRK